MSGAGIFWDMIEGVFNYEGVSNGMPYWKNDNSIRLRYVEPNTFQGIDKPSWHICQGDLDSYTCNHKGFLIKIINNEETGLCPTNEEADSAWLENYYPLFNLEPISQYVHTECMSGWTPA